MGLGRIRAVFALMEPANLHGMRTWCVVKRLRHRLDTRGTKDRYRHRLDTRGTKDRYRHRLDNRWTKDRRTYLGCLKACIRVAAL